MSEKKNTLKTCPKGHQFFKSSDCPVCPICERERRSSFLSTLGAPARRALENHGIYTVDDLAKLSEKEVLKFHGMGKASLPVLRNALQEVGLAFISAKLPDEPE